MSLNAADDNQNAIKHQHGGDTGQSRVFSQQQGQILWVPDVPTHRGASPWKESRHRRDDEQRFKPTVRKVTQHQERKVFVKDMRWLWATSAAVCEGEGSVITTRRIRFFARALAVYGSIKPIINAPQPSPLGKLIERRPETVGSVIWPYQCVGWNAQTRLGRIRDHYTVIEEIGGPIDFPLDCMLRLLDLGEIRKGLSVVVDQPKWLMREGQLSINLFLGELRIYSLVFSLFHHADAIAAFVGGIQGRGVKGALDEYRDLTKASHGMRPRDLLIEVFRMLCGGLGVTQIFAVADQYRHHRDRFFGKASKRKKFPSNYDEIWADRGGVRVDTMFFQLAVDGREMDIATIGARKRGMYRRRYEMLGRIKQQMHDNYRFLVASSKTVCDKIWLAQGGHPQKPLVESATGGHPQKLLVESATG